MTQETVVRREQATQLEWEGAPGELQQTGPAFIARTYVLERVFRRLRPRRLLDIGCGRGLVTAVASRHAEHVMATDLSAAAVRETNALLSQHPDAQACVTDVFSSDWGPHDEERVKMFDAVMLSEVLEHLEDDVKALAVCRDLLSDDGRLVLTVPGDPALWTSWDDLAGHKRRYRRTELMEKLKTAGFTVERITNWGFPLSGWLAYRGARMRSRRVEEQGRNQEVPSLIKRLLPAASVIFKIAARFEPMLSFLDRGAGYVVVAKRGSL